LVAAAPAHFVSIVDKAILCKKGLNEGPSDPPKRLGELSADDLLAVAVEDGEPLPPADVQVLAQACDIDARALGLESAALISGSP
jgi:hypothetical protein